MADRLHLRLTEIVLSPNDDGAYVWHWGRGEMSVLWSK